MPRIKRGTHRVKRRKNILARTKGMMWGRKSKITLAKPAALKAGVQAFIGRKLKKRNFRALQQMRINAAARDAGVTYNAFIHNLKQHKIALDRKILAEIAMKYPAVFKKLVQLSPKQ